MKVYSGNEQLRDALLKGAELLYHNVSVTLGPTGRNVILHPLGREQIVTKDGVTVAKFVEAADPVQNVAVQILRQAAEETNKRAGDGTTTSIVLAYSIFKEAQKYLVLGTSAIALQRGLVKAAGEIVAALTKFAKPVATLEDLQYVATISANNDSEIGFMVADAVGRAGRNGAVNIEETRNNQQQLRLELVEGFSFDSGIVANAFITDKKRGIAEFPDHPLILVTDHKLRSLAPLLPLLEILAHSRRPFVIVADEFDGQALAAFILNVQRGTMQVMCIQAPSYGEERRALLEDLALSTGATFIAHDGLIPLEDVKFEHLGTADAVISTKAHSTFTGGNADWTAIDKRIADLQQTILAMHNVEEAARVQERIAKLGSGVAIIHVGGATEIEMLERRYRVEDALEAVHAAQESGIIVGGGTALIRASQNLDVEGGDDETYARKILQHACCAPFQRLARNADEIPEAVWKMVDSDELLCYDFASRLVVNGFEGGIIEPLKVVQESLVNAVSAASTLLTADAAIVEIK